MTVIAPNLRILEGKGLITVSAGAFINQDVLLDISQGNIKIGENVHIAPRSLILTASHEIGSFPNSRATATIGSDTTIEDGCWLCAGSMILPGITVATGCIIAAGAVVVEDTEPNGIYAGVPARRIRDLSD